MRVGPLLQVLPGMNGYNGRKLHVVASCTVQEATTFKLLPVYPFLRCKEFFWCHKHKPPESIFKKQFEHLWLSAWKLCCIYLCFWFIGNVIMVNSLNNNFNWSLRDDICCVTVSHVLCTYISLNVQSGSTHGYFLSNSEFNKVCIYLMSL